MAPNSSEKAVPDVDRSFSPALFVVVVVSKEKISSCVSMNGIRFVVFAVIIGALLSMALLLCGDRDLLPNHQEMIAFHRENNKDHGKVDTKGNH